MRRHTLVLNIESEGNRRSAFVTSAATTRSVKARGYASYGRRETELVKRTCSHSLSQTRNAGLSGVSRTRQHRTAPADSLERCCRSVGRDEWHCKVRAVLVLGVERPGAASARDARPATAMDGLLRALLLHYCHHLHKVHTTRAL